MANYYIQKGTDTAKDIFATYGIRVKETVGMNQLPPLKEVFSRTWPDEQGDDIYIPTTAFFESKKVTITFFLQKTTVDEVKNSINSFLQYIISGEQICYFDTYKKNGFRGYYSENEVASEYYRLVGSNIEFDLDFMVPNGICYGFDNSQYSSIFVETINGTADVYFSDGTSNLDVSGIFIKNMIGGFVIVCPSIYGGISVTERVRKVLGISGKVLGIDIDPLVISGKEKVLGI